MPALKSSEFVDGLWSWLGCRVCGAGWTQADVNDGDKRGSPRRAGRAGQAAPGEPGAGQEIEILKRASAYFARENVLPK